jgi:hypothetical protein
VRHIFEGSLHPRAQKHMEQPPHPMLPWAIRSFTSRSTGVETTDLVSTSTFSNPITTTRYGKISLGTKEEIVRDNVVARFHYRAGSHWAWAMGEATKWLSHWAETLPVLPSHNRDLCLHSCQLLSRLQSLPRGQQPFPSPPSSTGQAQKRSLGELCCPTPRPHQTPLADGMTTAKTLSR